MSDSPMRLLRFPSAAKHDPAVDHWFGTQRPELEAIARPWFELMRDSTALVALIENASLTLRAQLLKGAL